MSHESRVSNTLLKIACALVWEQTWASRPISLLLKRLATHADPLFATEVIQETAGNMVPYKDTGFRSTDPHPTIQKNLVSSFEIAINRLLETGDLAATFKQVAWPIRIRYLNQSALAFLDKHEPKVSAEQSKLLQLALFIAALEPKLDGQEPAYERAVKWKERVDLIAEKDPQAAALIINPDEVQENIRTYGWPDWREKGRNIKAVTGIPF